MPNKTIYVSDDDLPLFKRAQELAGGALSGAIAEAVRRYVEFREGQQDGFTEVIVKVGPGGNRKLRFLGVLLGEWGQYDGTRMEEVHVYQTRTGKFAVHRIRAAGYSTTGGGWRVHFGQGEHSWASAPETSTLEVADSVEALRALIPEELYDLVAGALEHPGIEDLDI